MTANTQAPASAPRAWIGAIALCAILASAGAYFAPWLHYLFKPLTTLLIAAMVWRHGGDAEPGYRRAILIGLLLSTCGDVFLMLPGDWFVFGLGSFLCAHLAYLAGLCGRARLFAVMWPLLAYAALAAGVLAIVWPHLPGALRVPVIVYVAVLATMAAQAAVVWRRWPVPATALAALGGAFFVASDATLAIDRFAAPFGAASLAVLATYWIAQTLIGLSVRGLASRVRE
ncbi:MULTISPECIES: lysoplasmalogenase [Lysobacter]|uniref:lysoplasmalogenase n=1 Tax=Lysobacter TaxID=68 RepID=UPI001F379012|nr:MULTISPECIES: lysoplasmalogenase [Lysobacter]UJB21768.1 lysoplasmalogenase [Lysobacter capsici]UJQ29115.1 lysoplasmalogenase [Lysobacter gummosus]